MGNLLLSWASNHQQWLIGLATGFAMGHIDDVTALIFHTLMKIPFVSGWVVADPKRAKELIAKIQTELDKDIDAEAHAAPPKA